MYVRMVMKVLPPCVQHCCDADIGTQVFPVGSDDGESLGGSLKQQAIEFGLVLIRNPA